MCLILLKTQGSVCCYPHFIAGENEGEGGGVGKSSARLLYLKSCHFCSLVKGGFNQRVLGWPRETKQALRKDPSQSQLLGCT